jgi:hypothetical protein
MLGSKKKKKKKKLQLLCWFPTGLWEKESSLTQFGYHTVWFETKISQLYTKQTYFYYSSSTSTDNKVGELYGNLYSSRETLICGGRRGLHLPRYDSVQCELRSTSWCQAIITISIGQCVT